MIEERGEVFPPVTLDEGHSGVQALASAHAAVVGSAATFAMWPSVSDAGWLADAGIPTVIYGPGQLEHAHAVDESILIDELVSAAQVYATLILNWCNRSKPTTAQ